MEQVQREYYFRYNSTSTLVIFSWRKYHQLLLSGNKKLHPTVFDLHKNATSLLFRQCLLEIHEIF